MISFTKLFFHNAEIPFVGVGLTSQEITEKVHLQISNDPGKYEISSQQWIVCQDPFIIAIWHSGESNFQNIDSGYLTVLHKNKIVGKIGLKSVQDIPFETGHLMLMESVFAVSYHLNFLTRNLMLYYLRCRWNKEQAKNINNFCAAYSYPRKVVLISFLSGGHFNIFPMDFHGYIPQCHGYLLGLRKTNYTIEKILEQRRILVCEVPASKKDIIYQLGKHHGKNPPSADSLPFAFNSSKEFRFPYPEFTLAYFEVQLTHTKPLGTHILLMGKVINYMKNHQPEGQLYHIHTIHHLHAKNKTVS